MRRCGLRSRQARPHPAPEDQRSPRMGVAAVSVAHSLTQSMLARAVPLCCHPHACNDEAARLLAGWPSSRKTRSSQLPRSRCRRTRTMRRRRGRTSLILSVRRPRPSAAVGHRVLPCGTTPRRRSNAAMSARTTRPRRRSHLAVLHVIDRGSPQGSHQAFESSTIQQLCRFSCMPLPWARCRLQTACLCGELRRSHRVRRMPPRAARQSSRMHHPPCRHQSSRKHRLSSRWSTLHHHRCCPLSKNSTTPCPSTAPSTTELARSTYCMYREWLALPLGPRQHTSNLLKHIPNHRSVNAAACSSACAGVRACV